MGKRYLFLLTLNEILSIWGVWKSIDWTDIKWIILYSSILVTSRQWIMISCSIFVFPIVCWGDNKHHKLFDVYVSKLSPGWTWTWAETSLCWPGVKKFYNKYCSNNWVLLTEEVPNNSNFGIWINTSFYSIITSTTIENLTLFQ